MVRLISFLLGVLLIPGAALAQATEYLVRPGDRLEISVLEDPALNRTVLVRPDGRISIPIAGTVEAAGVSPEAVAATIRRRLSNDFVSPPTVTVSLVGLGVPDEVLPEAGAFGSIYVIGEVGSPGRLDVALPLDALQALAMANGPGPFAARHRIQVRRRHNGSDQLFLFDYDKVMAGLVPIDNIALQDGDVIVVPERRLFE